MPSRVSSTAAANNAEHDFDFDRVAAAKRGVPRAQLALAWVLQKAPVTAPIVGATKMHHLDDAVAALAIKLTPEEVSSLEEPYISHPVRGFN